MGDGVVVWKKKFGNGVEIGIVLGVPGSGVGKTTGLEGGMGVGACVEGAAVKTSIGLEVGIGVG